MMIKIILFFILLNFNAFARLLITPTRIDLNSEKPSQTLKLANETDETVTYKIEYKYQKMAEDGSYIPVPESEQKILQEIEKYVTFPKKEITLKPNQSINVKFKINKNAKLPVEERTAHILFQEVIKNNNTQKDEKFAENSQTKSNITIEIKDLCNIAIPVFVYSKPQQFQAKISNITLNKSLHSVKFSLENTGNFSPYGNITVNFFKGLQLLATEKIDGISITKPLKKRNIEINYDGALINSKQITSVQIIYKSSPELGKNYTITEEKLQI